jgi:hypothetical protein
MTYIYPRARQSVAIGFRRRRRISNNSDEGGLRQNSFGTLLDSAERIAKVFAAFVGTIYVIGYIVTTTRLAQYDVPAIRLLDAQYFVAGLLPGLLVWVTISVLILAFLYPSNREGPTLLGVLIAVGVLFFSGIVIELVVMRFSVTWSSFDRTLLNTSHVALKFVLGELALWLLIVGFRTKYFRRLRKQFKDRGEGTDPVWISIVMVVVLAAIALSLIPRVGWSAYNGLPQAYGGGKPLRIELYIDISKAPGELLLAPAPTGQSQPARTIPLNLILKTSGEYVVGSLADNSQRAWVLKGDAVYAEHIIGAGPP